MLFFIWRRQRQNVGQLAASSPCCACTCRYSNQRWTFLAGGKSALGPPFLAERLLHAALSFASSALSAAPDMGLAAGFLCTSLLLLSLPSGSSSVLNSLASSDALWCAACRIDVQPSPTTHSWKLRGQSTACRRRGWSRARNRPRGSCSRNPVLQSPTSMPPEPRIR